MKINVINNSIRDEIHSLLIELFHIMEKEKENNWIRGTKEALAIVSDDMLSDTEAIDQIRSIYRTMHSGPGSFGDITFWRDELEERVEINLKFSMVADKLWNLLEQYC